MIRKANTNELLTLWNKTEGNMTPTTIFFCNRIESGEADFWTLDLENQLIGELYVFYNLEDKDFANGKDKVYLCAFRINKDYRGKGYGTKLITTVIEEIKKLGFHYITIGVDKTEEDNIRLYRRLGFTYIIKESHFDPCDRDEEQKSKECSPFLLLGIDV